MRRSTRSRDPRRMAWRSACVPFCMLLAGCVALPAFAAPDAVQPAAARLAGPLPRVFFTPAERARISAARLAGRPMPAATVSTDGAAPVESSAPRGVANTGPDERPESPSSGQARTVRVDGLTLGHGSAAAVWIGGERIADGGRWGRWRVQVRRDGARLRAADGTVREVRVGMELQP
jgi:hypothetical protein